MHKYTQDIFLDWFTLHLLEMTTLKLHSREALPVCLTLLYMEEVREWARLCVCQSEGWCLHMNVWGLLPEECRTHFNISLSGITSLTFLLLAWPALSALSTLRPVGYEALGRREAPVPGGFSNCSGGLWWWKASHSDLRSSPKGRQAHTLALVRKAPTLCSHRRWM